MKIVIIEDDAFIRQELELLLENEGYQVFAVTNFQDATAFIQHRRPDLILLDLGLPGKDGFILCKEIRQLTRSPIIFVTSRDNSLDELKALSLGVTTTLPSLTTFRCCWPGLRQYCAAAGDLSGKM